MSKAATEGQDRQGRVRGTIPRLQAQRAHSVFLDAAHPDRAMVDVRTARQLVNRGETASSYLGGDTTSVVTTTIPDEDLDRLTLDAELQIVTEFEPDFYLPADAPTYTLDTPAQRIESVRECMAGTAWIAEQGLETEVIPLVKGVTAQERKICYGMFDLLDATQCGFYVGQYFTGGDGVLKEQLVEDVTTVANELEAADRDHELLVIGVLAPQTLKRLPDRVTAAAGLNTWRSEVEPRIRSDEAIRQRYEIVANLVESALGDGIPPEQSEEEPTGDQAAARQPLTDQEE